MAERDIRVASGWDINKLIDFQTDCIDPLALAIIMEALDYALETSASRLASAGKIFEQVEDSAYVDIMPTIKAIREALGKMPQCTPEGPRVLPEPTSMEEAIIEKIQSSPEKIKSKEDLQKILKDSPVLSALVKAQEEGKPLSEVKVPPSKPPEPALETKPAVDVAKIDIEAIKGSLIDMLDEEKKSASITRLEKGLEKLDSDIFIGIQDIEDSIESYRDAERDEKQGAFEEITEAIEGLDIDEVESELAKPKQEPAKPTKESPKSGGMADPWGKAIFEGEGKEAHLSGEYDSPGALASALGIKVRGATTTPKAFTRAGFEVKGNGDKPEKGKGKFIVRRVGPTERKYRLPMKSELGGELGEFEGPTHSKERS